MKILVEEYGFVQQETYLEYISEEFTIEVVQVSAIQYIVRLKQLDRFDPPQVQYKLLEYVDEVVGFVRTIFRDYNVEELIL